MQGGGTLWPRQEWGAFCESPRFHKLWFSFPMLPPTPPRSHMLDLTRCFPVSPVSPGGLWTKLQAFWQVSRCGPGPTSLPAHLYCTAGLCPLTTWWLPRCSGTPCPPQRLEVLLAFWGSPLCSPFSPLESYSSKPGSVLTSSPPIPPREKPLLTLHGSEEARILWGPHRTRAHQEWSLGPLWLGGARQEGKQGLWTQTHRVRMPLLLLPAGSL